MFLVKKKKFIVLFIYDGIFDWRFFKIWGNFIFLFFDVKVDDWNLVIFFVLIVLKFICDWEIKR